MLHDVYQSESGSADKLISASNSPPFVRAPLEDRSKYEKLTFNKYDFSDSEDSDNLEGIYPVSHDLLCIPISASIISATHGSNLKNLCFILRHGVLNWKKTGNNRDLSGN